MAHPADNGSKAASFAGTRLTPEEADRLASTFRPSWELDDAPFTGPGALSTADVQMLQGGGTHADVRAAAQATTSNGAHAVAAHTPPAPVTSHEPENSVIIDRSITADQIAPPKPAVAAAPAAPPAPAEAAPAPAPAPAAAATYAGPTGTVVIPPDQAPKIPPRAPAAAPAADRPPAARRQAAPAMSGARARAVSVDLDEPAFPKKSKKGLFVGLGAVAAVLVVGGIYMAASGSSSDKAAPAVPTATDTKANDKMATIPPPPPETATAAPAPPPPATTAPAAATVTMPAAPQPTTPPAPAPAPPPPPAHVAAAAPPRATPAGPPAPKPKKSGQTIVHDVPF